MSWGGTELPAKVKKDVIKIVALVIGICAVISMPIIASLGWFSRNVSTRATGMQVVVATQSYEILIDRTNYFTEDATDAEGELMYPNVGDLRDRMEADNYDLTQTRTSLAPMLGLELENQYLGASGERYLLPGSYGTLTFYLNILPGYEDRVIDFKLDLGGYKVEYDQETNDPMIVPVDDETALQLLKGHILFFTGCTGAIVDNYRYTGLIDDGTYQFDPSEHEKSTDPGKTDYYKVVFYWEWPLTFDDIHENTSPDGSERYPAELADYWDDNRAYFFASNRDSVELERLSDGYNDGDQLIGDTVNFILVTIE